MKNIEEFSRRMDQKKKKKTERVTGLGRRTREEKAKWNQMTALRFKTERKNLNATRFFP